MADRPEPDQAGDAEGADNAREPIDEFGARLKAARKQAGLEEPADVKPPPSLLGIAFRLSTEIVAALVVGVAIGIAADRFLGTSPWGLLIFFALGMAAAFLNVTRAAKALNAEAAKSNDPPADGPPDQT